ncbi:MbtH family protein [Micromonospora lupini]|uniref:MbtH family protein n=1 Tax=Micromonospora lupini TaxID=285679 RepID=UPI0033FB75DB
MFEDDDARDYQVVINDEEQYSIWPVGRELPPGWRAQGPAGTKAICLSHIDELWVDMRPRSLRLSTAEDTVARSAGRMSVRGPA